MPKPTVNAKLRMAIVPSGKRVALKDAPVGLFDYEGTLGIKTKTSTNGRPDAYIVKSGEYFWGGTTMPEICAGLTITPMRIELS